MAHGFEAENFLIKWIQTVKDLPIRSNQNGREQLGRFKGLVMTVIRTVQIISHTLRAWRATQIDLFGPNSKE
jgi:hypothetical protein